MSSNYPRSRAAMVSFLEDHFRYDTMSSVNNCTSYARNVKIHRLQFPNREVQNRAFGLSQTEEAYYGVNMVLREFAEQHRWDWQIGFNGRSSGYLVLYHGYRKPSEYKSWCAECGQGNCTVATVENSKCGLCGQDTRVNETRHVTGVYPGKNVDQGVDFSEWDFYDLRARVRLVRDFDLYCEKAIEAFVDYCRTHEAVEETIHVPQQVIVARRLKSAHV